MLPQVNQSFLFDLGEGPGSECHESVVSHVLVKERLVRETLEGVVLFKTILLFESYLIYSPTSGLNYKPSV